MAVFGITAWTAVHHPAFASMVAGGAPEPQAEILWAQVEILKPLPDPFGANPLTEGASVLPASVATPEPPVPTQRPTDLPTVVPTETLLPTPEPTETPASLAMEIIPPTPTSAYVPPTYSPPRQVYASSGNGARWIDVDLTHQRVYAYEGDVVVNSFVVSTGTWRTPTVTGKYKVYVKYRSANMSGPGYFLPDVPYIMYFHKGYGLHGTYWHNNFGTPMSHGCVNLSIPDAEWLYNWASVGTVVNVHY
jgi:lipoprotein-anchoring transpeptidase ErfK/SrfK